MTTLRTWQALSIGIVACHSALATPSFISSEIEGSKIIFCDLDGDGLKDAVLVNGLTLSIFFQDTKQGFTREPQLKYLLDDRPSALWPAKLRKDSESLLVMTSDGVAELNVSNRTAQPVRQQIIKQQTIIPQALDEPQVIPFPMSANTSHVSPLLIVPVANGLQVWKYRDAWSQAQFIDHSVASHIQPSVTNAGYSQSFDLNLSLSDINGDGRDDLMVKADLPGGMQTYTLYLQTADGRFDPALVYTNKADWRVSLCWVDINRDGKVDLIKSTFLNEPFFVPGMRSGKVLISVYLANERGQIPAEPQQIFRKSDWSMALPIVDVDGDGFVDLVLGYIPINPGEGFRKIITVQEVDFNLKFCFFRPGAGFSRDPDFERDLLIHFYREIFFTLEHRLYYEQFVSLNGDFNGDGKKDLLVRDHRDQISVYFFVSRARGFSTEADLRFSCPEPMDWWEVKDINGDGVSDLIVKLRERNAFRIFTSQK